MAQWGWKCTKVGENSICGQSWIYLKSPGFASQTIPPFHIHITLSIPNMQFEKRTIKFCLENTWHSIRFCYRDHCCPKAGQAITSFTRCNPKSQTPRESSKWPGSSSHTSLTHTSDRSQIPRGRRPFTLITHSNDIVKARGWREASCWHYREQTTNFCMMCFTPVRARGALQSNEKLWEDESVSNQARTVSKVIFVFSATSSQVLLVKANLVKICSCITVVFSPF